MTTQTSFLGGEISPLAAMRFDRPFHEHGMARLMNQTLRLQGPCETRPGTVDHGKLDNGESIGIDWTFSPSQSYAFILSNGRFDVVSNQTHAIVDADAGMPWNPAQFEQMTFAQQLDTMIVCHPDFYPWIVRRNSATEFSAAPFAFEGDVRIAQPHYKFAAAAITLQPSGTSGTISLVASAPVFVDAHVGARFRIVDKEVRITAVSSPTLATAYCRETLTATAATTDWTEQVFSPARGGARSAAFFGERLIFGGSRDRPLGLWASKIGRFFNFDVGTSTDSDAIWESVGDDVSEIRHMIVDRHLLVFGDRRYFMIANTETTPLTPKNFKAPPQDPVGASYCRPAHFDGGVVFVQADSNIVRVVRYNDIDQRYQVDDLNLTAPHLITGAIRIAATYATAPRQENLAHVVNTDGSLAVCLSNNQAQIQAWTPWKLGGGMLIKDAISVGDTTWLIVVRSSQWRLVRLEWDGAPLDMAVASGRLADPDYEFPGFEQFAQENVDVWTNGHSLGLCPVDADGVLHLPAYGPPALAVVAGYAFHQHLRPLPYIIALQGGTSSFGRVLGLRRVHVSVDDCGSFLVEGAPPPLTTGLDPDTPAKTYSGIVTAYSLGYDDKAQFDVVCDLPQRLCFLGFEREVVIGG